MTTFYAVVCERDILKQKKCIFLNKCSVKMFGKKGFKSKMEGESLIREKELSDHVAILPPGGRNETLQHVQFWTGFSAKFPAPPDFVSI